MGINVSEEPCCFNLLIFREGGGIRFFWNVGAIYQTTQSHVSCIVILALLVLWYTVKSPICCRFHAYELPIILFAIHTHTPYLSTVYFACARFGSFLRKISPQGMFFFFFWLLFHRFSFPCFLTLIVPEEGPWLAGYRGLIDGANRESTGGSWGGRGLIGNQSGWVERGYTCR
jgi:hypothetical protein